MMSGRAFVFRQINELIIELSNVVDQLNNKHGRARVRLAGQGYAPDWSMRRQWMSPSYTTNWIEILSAK